jgi:hypothetical protein
MAMKYYDRIVRRAYLGCCLLGGLLLAAAIALAFQAARSGGFSDASAMPVLFASLALVGGMAILFIVSGIAIRRNGNTAVCGVARIAAYALMVILAVSFVVDLLAFISQLDADRQAAAFLHNSNARAELAIVLRMVIAVALIAFNGLLVKYLSRIRG